MYSRLCNDDCDCGLKCDIYERDNKYYIECDIPGFDKDNIKLSYDNDYLTISCSKKDSDIEYLRRERDVNYERSFYIKNIDKDSIEAQYNNGVLLITMEKMENNSKYNIEIK